MESIFPTLSLRNHTYAWLTSEKSCHELIMLKMRGGIWEDGMPLWSRGQLVTSHSNPKEHKDAKGTHFKVLLISSWRHCSTPQAPWYHLRHAWSSCQAGCMPCSWVPTSFVFPALEPFPACGIIILWLKGLPIRHYPATIITVSALIYHRGLSRGFLIL